MGNRDSRYFCNRKEYEELSIYWISAALRFCQDSNTLSHRGSFAAEQDNKTKNESLRFCHVSPRRRGEIN